MHYKVGDIEIRTEYAAKSIYQASNYLINWISSMERVNNALDYGCGKLRYSGAIAARCKRLTLVDSKIQLARTQKIGAETTTIPQYAKKCWNNVQILSVDEFKEDLQEYDFILCANVLPIIPDENVRSELLIDLRISLKPGGRALFVTQYRNSYFKKIAELPNSLPHLDGWIVVHSKRGTYYGILPKDKAEHIVNQAGYEIEKSWIEGQSAYVLATK